MKSKKLILTLGVMVFLLIAASNSWAKRTIYGYVWLPNGKPAKNLGVIAWDDDGIGGGKNDYMNKAIINSQGYYRMNYKGGPWDTKVPGSTSFRPDIFITIHAVEAGKLAVKRSKVYKNWRMSRNLRIDLTVPGIMGKITGAPRSGLLIRAFDSDGAFQGRDDPIAQTKTQADGRYMMLYGGKHYDATPPSPGSVIGGFAEGATGIPGIGYLLDHIVSTGWDGEMHKRFTSWRPDIYIKVYCSPIKKSRTYKNWPHRKTLTINMNVASTPRPAGGGGGGSFTRGTKTRLK